MFACTNLFAVLLNIILQLLFCELNLLLLLVSKYFYVLLYICGWEGPKGLAEWFLRSFIYLATGLES